MQNRVSAALASLPHAGPGAGRRPSQKKSTSILEIVVADLAGRRATTACIISNYATINLVNELSRVPGVGNVNVLGVGQYSMRIWMDPQKLYTFGLTPERCDQGRPAAEPAGDGGPGRHAAAPPRARTSSTRSTSRASSTDPAQFANIIVKVASRQRRPHPAGQGRRRGSSWARRPTPRTSRSTASRPPASPSTRLPEANALARRQRGAEARWRS